MNATNRCCNATRVATKCNRFRVASVLHCNTQNPNDVDKDRKTASNKQNLFGIISFFTVKNQRKVKERDKN